jgi:ribonuclease HII
MIDTRPCTCHTTRTQQLAYHTEFPQYDFAQHKGYPTPAHKAALLRHGPCSIHRMTFKPIKK